ncbi:helix-turn-helix domain-containing protein [Bradyrhizobium sp. Pha-3]|uniref:helix-turn-helix domain-containing protein n=1 Tax=Bradyrhizobium sp. Pha-3 TaxID=208375 RepID=UPI0035D42B28
MSRRHRPPTILEMVSAGQREVWRDLVGQAEKLVLIRPAQALSISDICRSLAVSERTLRSAFTKIHGVPPCRRLRTLRLLHARKVLLEADRKLTTVTRVAADFGFSELGRFSVEYRKAFGESPSQTLSEKIPTCCSVPTLISTQRRGLSLHRAAPGGDINDMN